MPISDYFCCQFWCSNDKPKNKPDAQAALVQAREKLIATTQRIDPEKLTDITPESSRDTTPRGSVYSPSLATLINEDKPKTTCRCW